MVDFYKAFGLQRDMSTDEIRTTLDEQSRQWADRQSVDNESIKKEADQKIEMIDHAYSVLCNPKKRAAYDRALNGDPEGVPTYQITNDPTDSQLLIMRQMYLRERYDDVLVVGEKLLMQDSLNAEAMRYLALSYLNLGNLSEASNVLRDAIDMEPNDPELLYICADFAVHHSEDYSLALEYIDRLQMIDPERVDLHALRVECLLMSGNEPNAEEMAVNYLSTHSSSDHFRRLLAGVYERYAMTFRSLTGEGELFFDSQQDFDQYEIYVDKALQTCNDKHFQKRKKQLESAKETGFDKESWPLVGSLLTITIIFLLLCIQIDLWAPAIVFGVLTAVVAILSRAPRWKLHMYELGKAKRNGILGIVHALAIFPGKPMWLFARMLIWPFLLLFRVMRTVFERAQ